MDDERADFEREELAGLARQHGAKREYMKDGIGVWVFPPWFCPHCCPIGGPETEVLPGCPDPLARHGALPEETRERWLR